MIATLRQIVEKALDRLAAIVTTHMPPLLAGLIILGVSYAVARLTRWVLARMIKAAGLDRFLSQSGLASMLGRSGRLRAAALISGTAYWAILLAGALTALSAFDTALTTRMIEAVLFLLPKLAAAAAILLAGAWLGQYFSRSALVWASNTGIPYARSLAGAVRVAIVFLSVVVAADHLDFARGVFLAAFVILAGGVVLAGGIALGSAAHHALDRHFRESPLRKEMGEKTPWSHL